tara:strand:+ start:3675 stop:4184 length:510 start_codon:yes stop_codon:yes gene_type:complete
MLLDGRINDILREETEKLVADMKKNAGNSDLSKSIRAEYEDSQAFVLMNDYGEFVDKGVTGKNASDFKGKRKTVHKSKANFRFGTGRYKGSGKEWEKKIDKWMYKNGIQGRDKKGRFIKRKTTNFLIRRSIFQHGIKGTLFASKAFKAFNEELNERLSDIDFKNIIKQY